MTHDERGRVRSRRPLKIRLVAGSLLLTMGLVAAAQPALASSPSSTQTSWTTSFTAPGGTRASSLGGPAALTMDPKSTRHLSKDLQADLAAQMKRPQTYDAHADDFLVGARTRTAAAGTLMTLDQCKSGWNRRPVDTFWYYQNHFSACQISENVLTFEKCTSSGCTVEGTTRVTIAYLGALSDTARSFTWAAYLYGWNSQGQYDGRVRVSIEVPCTDYAQVGKCTANPAYGFIKTVDEWKRTPSVTATYTTTTPTPAPGDPHPNDKIAFFKMEPTVTQEGPRNPPPNPGTIVRCDNAAYVSGAGCVFTGVWGIFHLNYNQPAYRESVEFVWTAMHHLNEVAFPYEGLYVPGGDYVQPVTGHKQPLTRNYYGNRSRTKVQNECKRLFGDDYVTNRADGLKCDCDEYPFSATYENANYDTVGNATTFAVSQVYYLHNQAAGNAFGQWMTSDHLLDKDPFFVAIDNAPVE